MYLLDFGRWDPDQFSYCDLLKAAYMSVEMSALEEWTQISGAVIICTGEQFGWVQFKNLGFQDLKNSALMLQVIFKSRMIEYVCRCEHCGGLSVK